MARKPQQSSEPLESRPLSRNEIDRAISKLRRRIAEVEELDPREIPYDDARIDNVESNIRDSIREIFGQSSPEFAQHGHLAIWHGGYNLYDGPQQSQAKFAAGRPQTITKLEGLIARLEERREDAIVDDAPSPTTSRPSIGTRRVFLVHGRDDAAKETVARFLERMDLKPVILHEQPNQGKTIIEKFEREADVDFAVVLLTPDDVGHVAESPANATPRARQNVIFELGYFIGRLGRSRVCALYKAGIELPSDFDGVLYIPMDDPQAWRLLLAREIKAAGVVVDLNRAM